MTLSTLRVLGLCAAAAAIFAPTLAFAAAGHPSAWQWGMQDPVTPVGDYIAWFHDWILLPVIIAIVIFVMALLVIVMVKFNAKANPVPSKTTHNTFIEVIWTVVPVLILVGLAIPSMRLLYLQRDIPKGDMTIKAIGNPSWNWTYEYPDLGLNDDKSPKVSFTAYLLPEDKAKAEGRTYLLATDLPMVVPVNKTIKMIVTADPEGIMHAWYMPSFGVQMDAIPGRLNEDWFKATKEGVYNGECAQLCGVNHAYMPIEVWVVSEDKFKAWADLQLKGPKPDELNTFLKSIRPEPAVVAANN